MADAFLFVFLLISNFGYFNTFPNYNSINSPFCNLYSVWACTINFTDVQLFASLIGTRHSALDITLAGDPDFQFQLQYCTDCSNHRFSRPVVNLSLPVCVRYSDINLMDYSTELHYEDFNSINFLSSFPGVTSGVFRSPLCLLWARPIGLDFVPYRPRSRRSIQSAFIALLLLLAGDVEVNPGPAVSVGNVSRAVNQPFINFGCLNVHSASGKAAQIHDLIADRQLDLLALTETWVTTNTPDAIRDDIPPAGYSAIHAPRRLIDGGPTKGGGIAVVFRDSIDVKLHPVAAKITSSTCELLVARVGRPSSTFALVVAYRPQWCGTVGAFCDELFDVLTMIMTECNDEIVLCGDMNCPGSTASSVATELQSLLDSTGLKQHVNQATRGDNLLDVVASSKESAVRDVTVDDAGFISDHRLVSARLIYDCTTATSPTEYVSRNLRAIDVARFETALRSSELFSNPATTVDSYVAQIDSVVTALLDRFAPIRRGRRRRPKRISWWLSEEAVRGKRQRRKLERRYHNSRSEVDRRVYRNCCRAVNKLINNSRKQHIKQQLQNCPDARSRWRTVNELLHPSSRVRNNDNHVENSALCNSFSKFFVDKIANLKLLISHKASLTPPFLQSSPPFTGTPLSSLPPVTSIEVLRLLANIPCKSSPMDFVATSLLKSCRSTFADIIAKLANMSFSEGVFPTRFKIAQITPLLKKEGLDKASPSNYRPISNLNNISKILERLFLNRIQSHVTSCPNFNSHQSAYRRHHSTETSLLYTISHICHAADAGCCTLLVSLDLSAAFDTVDHTILSRLLSDSFGFRDSVIDWINSYLSNRSQYVRIGSATSSLVPLTSGVPQGSVLGPILFTIYTSPIAHIASSHNVLQQQYADDTQLFISLSPGNVSQSLTALEICLSDLCSWFYINGLALNPDKSDAVLFGTQQRLRSFPSISSINVAGSSICLSDHVKILGVILDNKLTFNSHVDSLCRSSFFHLRSLRYIRPSLNLDIAKAFGSAIIGSRLDYANSILYNTSSSNIHKLQRVQNALSRVVLGSSTSSRNSAHNLHLLHWLPIHYRILYKLSVLTFHSHFRTSPTYLSSLISTYTPSRSLRSSGSNLLNVPRSNIHFTDKSFDIAGPTVWNSLPSDIRSLNSLPSFTSHLKTHFFRQAFL